MELFIKLRPGDGIKALLTRAGVAGDEAALADSLIAGAGFAMPPSAEVAVLLGDPSESGRRKLQRVSVRSGLELKLIVSSDGSGGLQLLRQDIPVDSTPLRFTGRSGRGLYWSMRAGGVPADVASEYLSVVSRRMDISRELGPDDRFDLILAYRRASTGERQTGPLLYAGIDRRSGPDLQLVNWSAGGRSGWFDAGSGSGQSAGMIWPVAGRITSRFGTRIHPILRFPRFHSGVDVSSPWGSPIVAAADGRVVAAGWNGGRGRQVRIAHDGGLETSYSHMSQIAATPGTVVRRGQLIGYVGSTGLSTGPHLHYEVRDDGQPVDPVRAGPSGTAALSGADMAALRARLRQLLGIDGSRLASLPETAVSS